MLVSRHGRGRRDRRDQAPAGARHARQDNAISARTSTQTQADRSREADEYYAALRPQGASDEEAMVMRQAFAGMGWSLQFYHYDVPRWLDGDKVPPPSARKSGRNSGWRHLSNHHIVAMPDKWEYPWYASWDLAFHSVVLAHTDPAMAKNQLLLLAREWYMHPNGQLPAYEWNFSDVNPPVQAWAALAVFRIDGGNGFRFPRAGLQQAPDQLHLVGQPRGRARR